MPPVTDILDISATRVKRVSIAHAGADGIGGAIADEAKGINQRLAGWQYQLPDYKNDLLVRRWDDLLKALD